MKTIIYYFTGTGNSLAAARNLGTALGDTELVSIASLRETEGEISPDCDRIGIVCPVYDCGVPVVVAEFAERLDTSKAKYMFSLVTFGGMGVSALHQLNGIFKKREVKTPDAAFVLTMPGNFTPLHKPPSAEKKADILAKAEVRLDEITAAIRDGKKVSPKFAPLSSLAKLITYGPFCKNVHESGANFSVSDECTLCGICEKVCPVENIKIADGKPQWDHKCELCCACLHFCPVEAIQLNVMKGTEGRGRYLHPDLKISDMEIQQGKLI